MEKTILYRKSIGKGFDSKGNHVKKVIMLCTIHDVETTLTEIQGSGTDELMEPSLVAHLEPSFKHPYIHHHPNRFKMY